MRTEFESDKRLVRVTHWSLSVTCVLTVVVSPGAGNADRTLAVYDTLTEARRYRPVCIGTEYVWSGRGPGVRPLWGNQIKSRRDDSILVLR